MISWWWSFLIAALWFVVQRFQVLWVLNLKCLLVWTLSEPTAWSSQIIRPLDWLVYIDLSCQKLRVVHALALKNQSTPEFIRFLFYLFYNYYLHMDSFLHIQGIFTDKWLIPMKVQWIFSCLGVWFLFIHWFPFGEIYPDMLSCYRWSFILFFLEWIG